MAAADETLQNSRQLWLSNPLNFSDEKATSFVVLRDRELKMTREWAATKLFRRIWCYRYEGAARRFFKRWQGGGSRNQIKPLRDLKWILQRHLKLILTYLRHPIAKALTEGLNYKIQLIHCNERLFRNFAIYRIRILLNCGKLNFHLL